MGSLLHYLTVTSLIDRRVWGIPTHVESAASPQIPKLRTGEWSCKNMGMMEYSEAM